MPNETLIWGIVKWVKNNGGITYRPQCRMIFCLNPLPCFVVILSSAQAKLHLKNGSPKPPLLPGGGSKEIMDFLLGSVMSLISIIGQSIKEANLKLIPEGPASKQARLTETVRSLNMGTPNQLILINSRSFLSLPYPLMERLGWTIHRKEVSMLTFWRAKLKKPALKSLVGGKIAEKANALSNSKDTVNNKSEVIVKRGINNGLIPLNSVCLNKILQSTSLRRAYSTQNLSSNDHSRSEAPSLSTVIDELPSNIKEQVELKQRELVRLAERYGLSDNRVLKAQILMVRSILFRTHAANLLAKKPGSQTPGVDNEIIDKADMEKSKLQIISWLRDMVYHPSRYSPQPIKRVWIPKPGKSEKRPLGIPAIKDRALQTLVNLVLLPLVEMTSDEESYGFRPYRDCKMAVSAVRMLLKSLSLETQQKALYTRFGKKGLGNYTQLNENKWILDADIKGFFDNINHEWLINNLFLHPILKEFVSKWLKAKILDAGMYSDPTNGTPQVGIISPTLANFTLNGLEKAVNESIHPITTSKVKRLVVKKNGRSIKAVSLGVAIVRYADDFIILSKSKNIITKYIRPAVDQFLAERGLSLSPTKTKLFTLKDEGAQLDFLGYTFKYQSRWSAKRNVFYTKGYKGGIALYPNKEKVRNFIKKLSSIFDNSNNLTAVELIMKLNPIIRGWANYYNLDNSTHYRSIVRRSLYLNCWKWMTKKHPTLGKRTLAKMYFLMNANEYGNLQGQIDENSPDIDNAYPKSQKPVYTKFLNSLWNFRGLSSNTRRFSKKDNSKIVYLLEPGNAAKILSTSRNVLPRALRKIHAFHEEIPLIKKIQTRTSYSLQFQNTFPKREAVWKTERYL